MFWDLIQQMQIDRTERHAMAVDERLAALERQVDRNNEVLVEVIKYLEKRDGRDLDGDGEIG
jgi:hypothetical protein